MSQAEVVELLEKYPNGWYSTRDIFLMLKGSISMGTLSTNLKKAVRAGRLIRRLESEYYFPASEGYQYKFNGD